MEGSGEGMRAYYNEIDKYAAQWLRNLITAGHIANGDVDERSIEDVTPNDIYGYTQCHFFAGIGGWSLALRLSGWEDSKPVWTGSCPCQPFSKAGKGKGASDERHLWPSWFHLIRVCKPCVVFGEQVEAAINHGWLDLVQSDMEGEGYAFGAFGIPACGVGASHMRQRLWFVSHTPSQRREGLVANHGVSFSPGKTLTEFSDPFTPAVNALAGDNSRLLLSDGVSVSVERQALKAYGNAIVPQVAAEVIKAYMECRP